MKTKNAQTLGVHLPDEIVDMIIRRARHNNVSKSKFAALVLKRWAAENFPAVSTVDSTARILVKQELDTEKALASDPAHKKSKDKSAGLRELAKETARESAELGAKINAAARRKAS